MDCDDEKKVTKERELYNALIDKHIDFLEERIDPDSQLLDKLRASGSLTWKEVSKIKDRSPSYERNSQLLDYILKNREGHRLVAALQEAQQMHIANYLIADAEYKTEFGGVWPLTVNEISILDTNSESLADLLELSQLLNLLFSKKVISGRQMDSVSSKPTSHEKSETLLEILRRRSLDDYKQTIICLHQTKQSHIADILDKGGALVRVHVELGGDEIEQTEEEIISRFKAVILSKPAEERRRLLADIQIIAAEKGHSVVLYIYCKSLKDLVELREMQTSGELKTAIERLFSQLLSPSQYTEVNAENLNSVVESIFTHLLHRFQTENLAVTFSNDEYKKCRSLFPGDIMMRAILDFDPKQMSNKEKYELQEITQLKKQRRKRNLWGDEEVVKNHSDEMFYSEENTDPKAMVLSFEKGNKMKTIPPANIGDNVGWWMVRHLDSGKVGFIPRNRVVIDFASEDQTVKTTIDELPLELLDIVLQKSYLLYALHNTGRRRREEERSTTDKLQRRRRDEFLINRLSSVDFCWSQRFKRNRFKRNIRRHLSDLHEESKTGIVAIICRNNRSYFEENIRLKGLMKRLRSADCLTDLEARLLNCRQIIIRHGKAKSFSRNSNPELLHLMRHFDEKSLSTVVSCLRKRSQRLPAMVAENGGAVFKAIVPGRRAAKRSLVGQEQLVQSINDLRDKTKPRSHEIEEVISQLRDDGIEILSSTADDDRQTIVVWIWCQSQKAVEMIERINDESSNLLYSFLGLAILLRSHIYTQPSADIHLCKDQFKRCIELRSTVIVSFTERIEVGEAEYVGGITKLRNEIYVLCQSYSASSHVIRVFKDRNPFRLEKKLEIKEIKFPVDIGSCEKENCLFVIDQGEDKCVWKVTIERDDEYRIIKWLRLDCPPRVLSVSSAGQLLIVRWRERSSVLSMYGLDAKLLRSVQLPSDVMHAVETSIGNFVILSKDWREVEAGESGYFTKAAEIWSIYDLTRDGQKVVRRFVSSSEMQQPNSYVYLLLDSDDRVFVADRWNNRVILLDSDLRWNRILCPTNEGNEKIIFQPKRLCYDEESNQLIVGGNLIGQGVNVYTLQRKFSRSSQQD